MTDVVLVCVRGDIERAEALAEMFEDFGFSVSDSADDEALRWCGAGGVVWSDAAKASPGFVAAVGRVIASGKCVVLNFTNDPAPEGAALCFDLTAWSGDPDDAALDRMFFAMDRMIIAGRVSRPVGRVVNSEPKRANIDLPAMPVVLRGAPAPALRTMAASLVVIGVVLGLGIAIGRAAPEHSARVSVPAEYSQSATLADVAPVNLRYDLDAREAEDAPIGHRGFEPPSADFSSR